MSVTPPEPIRALTEERAALRARFEAGMGGLEHARALCDAMDRAITGLWEQGAPGGDGMALVALGGYGRGEMNPHSDVDLMVLHDGHPDVAEQSQRLFYALWDAGFKVGHATRTIKEALRLAKENLEAETSFLELRLVSGDRALFEAFQAAAIKQTRKRSDRFVADVREMMRVRHVTGGSATSQLEPNLKEGAGGLRDLHVLRWFGRVEGDLQDAGLVGAREAKQLANAEELLHRVRTYLHYVTDRATDVLLFQHQRPAALFLGYADGARAADDAFMRDLFTATRAVEHAVTAVVTELTATSGRQKRSGGSGVFGIVGGRVVVEGDPDLARAPELGIELFTQGAPPGSAALRWLEEGLAAMPEVPWTPAVRAAFYRLLRAGHPAVLEAADHAGLLGRLLPGWDAVRCQPQRNVYHGFTVDAHLFNTVTAAAALGAPAEESLVRDVWDDLGDQNLLLLAALLHDIGKGTEEDHSIRGETMALAVCDRMGIEEPWRSTVGWLVRHHLLFVEAATRRDLNDENLVVDVAEKVGDVQRARMLFLLSIADGRATGPTAWSPWKASLVTELFTKVVHVLERGELASRDASELAHLRANELRAGLARYPEDLVDRHLSGVPRAYLLAFPTTVLVRHFSLMAEDLGPVDVRTHVEDADEPGVYGFTMVARDRPGLFGQASGVLALNGINIVGAEGFTRSDGIALEIFQCVGAFEPSIPDAKWKRVEQDMRRALGGRLALDVRLAEKREAYGGRVRKGKASAPKIIIDNAASDFLTVVEVHAPDRVGLLYDITSAFTELAIDIRLAKIATYGEDVVDVFYVRDLEGQKITDPEHLSEIEHALSHRVAE